MIDRRKNSMSILSAVVTKDVHDDVRKLDDALMRVGRGDREAFAEVYERSRGAVYATALSYLKDTHRAEDITHDTFIRIWDSSHRCRQYYSPRKNS